MCSIMPVNCTTVGACNIVFEVDISEYCVSTVLQIYCSTSTTKCICIIEFSLIVNEPTVIYSTINTRPYDSTTITNITMNIRNSTFSTIIGKDRIIHITIVTTPKYSTTISISYVMGESGIIYITIMSTILPINSSTIKTCEIISKDRVRYSGISTVFCNVTMQEYCTTTTT